MADLEEFEALVVPLYGHFLNRAQRLTGNHDDAEDLVQAMYLKAWRSFHTFQIGTNIEAWLETVIASVFKTNKGKQNKRPEEPLDDDPIDPRRGKSEEEDLLEELGIEEALSGLSELDRSIVKLKIDKLTHVEITERLGITENELGQSLNQIKLELGLWRLSGEPVVDENAIAAEDNFHIVNAQLVELVNELGQSHLGCTSPNEFCRPDLKDRVLTVEMLYCLEILVRRRWWKGEPGTTREDLLRFAGELVAQRDESVSEDDLRRFAIDLGARLGKSRNRECLLLTYRSQQVFDHGTFASMLLDGSNASTLKRRCTKAALKVLELSVIHALGGTPSLRVRFLPMV